MRILFNFFKNLIHFQLIIMNRKTLCTIIVVIIYVILIGIYSYLATKSYDCSEGPCVRFCEKDLRKYSDEFIKEKFTTYFHHKDFSIVRGEPKCFGGLDLIDEIDFNAKMDIFSTMMSSVIFLK